MQTWRECWNASNRKEKPGNKTKTPVHAPMLEHFYVHAVEIIRQEDQMHAISPNEFQMLERHKF